ncbi:hypothetical protein [Acidisphaera sp. L21]|uniref:hypothetical protein n=1 Tax=Acidisphaera sp. L21 TaxID=1641851 RepID=UPI00131AA9C4|nr:hypothetical protein [Acidisphaera sp. L21]
MASASFQPTPLDLALAQHPTAEADSRAVAEAAQPPDWARLDAVAHAYTAAFERSRAQLHTLSRPEQTVAYRGKSA